nr:hypothetical protein [Mucilaginibacter sp. FT3.2]
MQDLFWTRIKKLASKINTLTGHQKGIVLRNKRNSKKQHLINNQQVNNFHILQSATKLQQSGFFIHLWRIKKAAL